MGISKNDNKIFISAKDVADEVYDVNGLKVYKLSECYFSPNKDKDEFLWQFTAEGIIRETSNYDGADILPLVNLCPRFTEVDRVCLETVSDVCMLFRHYTKNYFHFLTEVVDKIIALEKWGYKGRYLIGHTKSAEEIIDLMGISHTRIIWIRNCDNKIIYARNVMIPEPANAFNNKTTLGLCTWGRALSERVCNQSNVHYPSRVYVKRIGSRKLLDADETLQRHGFFTIVPEKLSVIEQIRFFFYADMVLSPHGANTTNCLFMRSNSLLIETFGCDYINPCCYSIINELKLRYIMLCESHAIKEHRCGNYTRPFYDSHMYDDYMLGRYLLEMTLSRLIT